MNSKARIAALFYLLVFVTGGLALTLGAKYIVSGDAPATAANILAHEQSYRLGFAVNLLASFCYVVVTALFYELFKPAGRTLSMLAAFFSLVGCATGAIGSLLHLAPLVLLNGAKYLNVFAPAQLQSLAYMFLRMNTLGNNISIAFFGCYCLLIGTLVLKSTFVPRFLGILMLFAGVGWLTGSFATFLSPPLAARLYPYILLPGVIGEGVLTLWLLVMGVNVQRWKEQAGNPVR